MGFRILKLTYSSLYLHLSETVSQWNLNCASRKWCWWLTGYKPPLPCESGPGLHPYTILGTARVGEVECHYLNGGSTKCCRPWGLKKCLPNSRREAKCQTCLITPGFFWPCFFCPHWGAHLEEGRDSVTSLPSQVSKINGSSGNK